MLEFLEDAAVELELAVAWYDTQRPGLGAEFLDALRAAACADISTICVRKCDTPVIKDEIALPCSAS